MQWHGGALNQTIPHPCQRNMPYVIYYLTMYNLQFNKVQSEIIDALGAGDHSPFLQG